MLVKDSNSIITSAPLPAFAEQLSTRLAFLIAGLGMSSWAPLVPFAKERLAVNEATLGLLLLCLGAGSLAAMPLTGMLAGRLGCRKVIVVSALVMCVSLVCLTLAPSVLLMALALLFFGSAVGTVDVAMNIQAVIVERASGRNMMSGFHGFYSLGGILGAAGVSALLWLGFTPFVALLVMVGLILILLVSCAPKLLAYGSVSRDPLFVRPQGKVLLIGCLCFIVFLAEGSVLDWSAVFLTSLRDVDPAQAGLGFAGFSVAMTVARLMGDRIVRRLGGTRIIFFGGLCAAAGFLLVVLVPAPAAAFLGFVLVGLGASNVVPVLFTAAGNQKIMPMGLAIAAVATMGYAGILAGPAIIGLVAQITGLSVSLALVALGLLVLASCARRVTRLE
jgi:predicted MFS family arabinose efflux permease